MGRESKFKSNFFLDNFIEFLSRRCQNLEHVQNIAQSKDSSYTIRHDKRRKLTANFSAYQNLIKCLLCEESHVLHKCPKFLNKTLRQRYKIIKRLNLCINCLKSGHSLNKCPSSVCTVCSRKYHSLLHFNDQSFKEIQSYVSKENIDSSSKITKNNSSNSTNTFFPEKSNAEVLLATALIDIISPSGQTLTCRAILDSGSQANFITKNICDILQLPKYSSNTIILGINRAKSKSQSKTDFMIKSKVSEFQKQEEALVIPKICCLQPVLNMDTSFWSIPKNIQLADPNLNRSKKIDCLLGAEIFWSLLCVGQISLGKGLPIIQKTNLGWIISGKINLLSQSLATEITSYSTQIIVNPDNHKGWLLQKFWELEEVNGPK